MAEIMGLVGWLAARHTPKIGRKKTAGGPRRIGRFDS